MNPVAMAAGTMLGASLFLAGPAAWQWPHHPISPHAWVCLLGLAVFCTSLAYILYFRLINKVGPSRATSVTYLIPAFAMGWGALWLDEAITPHMAAGCAVILLGTALTTGMIAHRPRPALGHA